jgi:alginate O-acetyltransferase complex protein AlgI
MNFASFPYLVFLALVVLLYFSSGKNYKSYILLGASYFFYFLFGVGFTALMLITTTVTYWTSSKSYYAETLTQRKFYFWLGFTFDLIVFVLFKYFHWIDIHLMNWPNFSAQDLLIPIGISFYTFKTLGYCIDLYKRKYEPIESFHIYALSVSFFPQLIAGPIEKSKTLALQFVKKETFIPQNFINGGKLILWGTFKKVVIADSIAQVINPCFAEIEQYDGIGLWILLLGFTYQIYVDFSGYSDIAIGSAMLFNIYLPANFNKPFFSKSIGEFWSRWHITFSKWLKEYVFDNIGGVVKGNKLRTVLNIWIIFLLVGFWHGATLNFMLYAMVAFVWFVADVASRKKRKKWFKNKGKLRIINYITMILLMMTMGIFFRPLYIEDSLYILSHLFSIGNWGISFSKIFIIIGLITSFEFLQYFQRSPTGTCVDGVKHFNVRALLYLLMIFTLIFLSLRADVTFQYYQF